MKKTRGAKTFSFPDYDDYDDYEDYKGISPLAPSAIEVAMREQLERYQAMRQYQYQTWAQQPFSGVSGALGGALIPTVPKVPAIDLAKLDSLKLAEPRKVQKRMPDYVHVLTGWRAWRVDGLRLKALGQNTIWEPKKQLSATCEKSSSGLITLPAPKHEAPQMGCTCGVWAFKDLDRLTQAVDSYSGIQVLGQVSLWGRVVETQNGFRAQYAYPSELWLLNGELEELGWVYDVPVRTV